MDEPRVPARQIDRVKFRDITPVVVCHHTRLWIQIALRSFHQHFPGQRVLVVDNNPDHGQDGWTPDCESERAWLGGYADAELVKNASNDRSHGAGMDLALKFCLQHEVPVMLHFEPDCLITGTEWYEAMARTMASGAWMTGLHRKRWGPIHPCPSMWRTDKVQLSFNKTRLGADAEHPRIRELFDVEKFPVDAPLAQLPWDTGLKCWFAAAVEDRAVLTRERRGFRHVWAGSTARRQSEEFCFNPAMFKLLDPPDRPLLGYLLTHFYALRGWLPTGGARRRFRSMVRRLAGIGAGTGSLSSPERERGDADRR